MLIHANKNILIYLSSHRGGGKPESKSVESKDSLDGLTFFCCVSSTRLVVQLPTGIHYQLLKMFTVSSSIASPEILADNICTCHAYHTDAYIKCVVSCLHQMCITLLVYRWGEGMVHNLGAKPVTEIGDSVSTFADNFQQ